MNGVQKEITVCVQGVCVVLNCAAGLLATRRLFHLVTEEPRRSDTIFLIQRKK